MNIQSDDDYTLKVLIDELTEFQKVNHDTTLDGALGRLAVEGRSLQTVYDQWFPRFPKWLNEATSLLNRPVTGKVNGK